MTRRPPVRFGRRFLRDEAGSNAVEFAILGVPFIMLLLFSLQIGLWAMTKMALDTGVLRSAESLEGQFAKPAGPTLPSGSGFKAALVTNAGGLVINNSALAVEVRPLVLLSASATPIADGTMNFGAAHSVLAIRASFVTPNFVPGLNAVLTSYSSALVRRQAQ